MSSPVPSNSHVPCDWKKCAMMTTKTTPWVTHPVRCVAHLAIGRERSTEISKPGHASGSNAPSRRSSSMTTRRILLSTARILSPARPSIIVAQVSVASAKSIHASMRPTCKAMATIITAAEKPYSTKRSQVETDSRVSESFVSSARATSAEVSPMTMRRWRLRRARAARSKTAAANWNAKDKAKKLTTSQWSDSTRPVSSAAGETGMEPTMADLGGSHVGYPALESARSSAARRSMAVASSGGIGGDGRSPQVA